MPASLKIAVGRASASGSTAGKSPAIHLWETALIELEQGTPSEIAKRIQGAVTSEDRQQWQQGTPEQWALESLAIIRAQVYRLPATGEITGSYTEPARAVMRTRLAQAGAGVDSGQELSVETTLQQSYLF